MQKNIAMISYHTCPLASVEGKQSGGMNVYVLELSKKLAEFGIKVDIYTRIQDANDNPIVQISENLRVIHLKAGPKSHISKKETFNFIQEFVRSFENLVETEGLYYDLLHCHYYLSGLIGLEIQKKNYIPIVQIFHTLALMKNLVARNTEEQETNVRIEAERLLVRKVQKIITPSESELCYLRFLYDAHIDNLSVITPGVDTTIFKPTDKELAKQKVGADLNHKIILFVGRIEPLKGIDSLIYAIKILTNKNPSLQICLWIVGGDISQLPNSSAEIQRLEALRSILDLKTIVKFVGQKDQTHLPDYYNAAEIVVMPSHYESFGMSALESMACGTPVITTNVSGVSTLLDDKHKSLITSAHNPLLLAENMEILLTDNSYLKNMSAGLSEKVQDLDWKNVAQRTINLYDTLS